MIFPVKNKLTINPLLVLSQLYIYAWVIQMPKIFSELAFFVRFIYQPKKTLLKGSSSSTHKNLVQIAIKVKKVKKMYAFLIKFLSCLFRMIQIIFIFYKNIIKWKSLFIFFKLFKKGLYLTNSAHLNLSTPIYNLWTRNRKKKK